ncbi:MAG: replicative DNA helicase [Bacillota bacterium]
MILEKAPPQNLEAEQAVLGSMMLEREAIYTAAEILRAQDFYRDAHQVLFQVMADLAEKGEPVDLVTVVEELRRRGNLENIGGATYVASLANMVPTAANTAYYAQIVADKALLRAMIHTATTVAMRGYEGAEDPEKLLDEAEKMFFQLSQNRNREGFSMLKDVLIETFERIELLAQHKEGVTGVPTFRDLDKLLSGLQKSDLVICAARPGMGKTSFCLNIAQIAAVKHGIPVAIFSLEMSKEQLAQRMLASEAMVDQHKLRTGFLQKEDWKRLVAAVGPLSEAQVFIDDTPSISAMEIRAKARRLKAEHNLGLIVVDYLQLMQGHKRVESRQQEIAQISRALKALARELDVPVLALSQLNRGVEQRQDKRPIMADLLESGAIEADADLIIFLYRPQYYDPETEKRGIAEVIVAKHRNGPVGTVEMAFFPEFTKFMDLALEPVG